MKLKTQLVSIAAATLGLSAYGCGGGDEAAGDDMGTTETGGGEASYSGSGVGTTEPADDTAMGLEGTEGDAELGVQEDAAGGEASCGAGSCGGVEE